ncbi:amidase family protein [Grimontia sp. NTOU-MAR1]|uniref:amidase family protein n=1 Tax=Grimontia sp. NTOU-MAR1 TaxID=3111011 RepID=UPI002DB77A6D|nr:amidase family protein [Grimontia sp. NTOU-MAR1]WRV98436.1 amidase family protein [Grimontia sp. NTOU-MAR1]
MAKNNYLINEFKPERQDISSGVLARQKLVVSDSVGLKDTVTGIGVPAWSDGHAPAHNDAHVVSTLMQSGCRLIGKTQVDEFGISISGKNPFLARLKNPVSPFARLGGSSSGAAIAVSKGSATIGIGNDCCGGVLIPASYSGLFGYRPSQGMVDLRGIAPFSPSFDAVGFMTKHLSTLEQIAEKCWTKPPKAVRLGAIVNASSLFHELLSVEALLEWEEKLAKSKIFRNDMPSLSKLTLAQAYNIHSVILGREVDLQYGQWLDEQKPKFSDETEEHLKQIRGKSFKEFVETKKKREFFSDSLQGFFKPGEVLMIPTSPGQPPKGESVDESFLTNQRRLYAIAEVAGLSQLTLPLLMVDGVPMGVSLLAYPGEDRLVFEAASRWYM